MTVCENLLMGSYMRGDGRVVTDKDLDFVLTTFPAERLNQDASTLSGGEQQMCAIGRGIMRGLPPPASCSTLAVSCCPGRPPNSSSEA